MFLRLGMAAVIYLDGVLIFAKTDNEIVELVDSLRKDFDLKLEGTVSKFLGMKIELSAMGYVISLPGLSERILNTMSLVDCNTVKAKPIKVQISAIHIAFCTNFIRYLVNRPFCPIKLVQKSCTN